MSCLAIPRTESEEIEGTGAFTESEARQLFDLTAQRYLGMSGEQFLRKWDAKEFSNPEMQARALRVAHLIPLVRYIRAGKKAR